MMIIVGLGNPGKEYAKTPHNVGFMAVDMIAEYYNIKFMLSQTHQAMIGEGIIEGEKCYLLKPLTYMNLSGNAVRSFMEYYKYSIDDLLVIFDDLDLPLGKIRIRETGSSGGHKGMKSIIENLGTDKIKRIRIGIGKPTDTTVVDYVLHTLTKEEYNELNNTIEKTPLMIKTTIKEGIKTMMNEYNGK